jgi:penicillin-binding protein 1A
VLVSERAGRRNVIDLAKRYGIVSPMDPVPSLPLGTFEVTLLELTGAYQPIASGGLRRPAYGVTEVADGRDRIIYRHQATQVRVVDPRVAAAMQQLMVAVIERGTGKAAKLGDRLAGGKTGTTQNARDAWFMGYAGDYIAGVWVGNDEAKPMKGVSGSNLPAQIWREVMLATPKGEPPPAAEPQIASAGAVPRVAVDAARDGLGWLLDTVERTFGRMTQ